jgi:hypothetical protein
MGVRDKPTSMMPECIKPTVPVILHSIFNTFSSLTLGGSSGASGDDNLGKSSWNIIQSNVRHDSDKVTHVRTKVPVMYCSTNFVRELLVPEIETPGISLR